MTRPFILGLTGSIGMGKSEVGRMFEAEGVPVFDADAAVHAMQGPGGVLLQPIEQAFPGTTGPDGVDRPRLGELVFGNDAAMRRLETIVHPAVARQREQFLARNAAAPLVVFDIPLLFETGAQDRVDGVLVVSAPADVQRARVLARPGMSEERFAAILARQVPDEEKRKRADFLIDTELPLAETAAQVTALIAQIRSREALASRASREDRRSDA